MARKKKSGDSESSDERTNLSDDTFGLPEIHYEPIRKDKKEEDEHGDSSVEAAGMVQATEASDESSNTTPSEPEPEHSSYETETVTEAVGQPEEEPKSEASYSYADVASSPVWPKILGLVAVILLAGSAAYYFLFFKPKQDEEERRRQLALQEQQEAERKQQEEAERLRLIEEERERRRRDSLAAIPKTGSIETLEQRTGLYYVVISSAVDGDLIMDLAKKLSEKGVSTKVIPPFGKYKFYRLAVDEGDSFMAAQAKAEGLKQEYGEKVWVLKY